MDRAQLGKVPSGIPPCPGGVHTDLSNWPVIVMQPPSHAMADADFQAYLDWMEKHITTRRVPYAVVNDARGAPPPSASQRKMVAAQMERLAPFTSEYCKGASFVFESAMMRGIMTAIFWITKPSYPVNVFGNVGSAVEWCNGQLSVVATARSLR